MKNEKRFQFILSSLAAGCFAGWCFFELGGSFSASDNTDAAHSMMFPETYVLEMETETASADRQKSGFLEERACQAERSAKLLPEKEERTLYQAAAQKSLIGPHVPKENLETAPQTALAGLVLPNETPSMLPSGEMTPPGEAVLAHTAPSMGSAVPDFPENAHNSQTETAANSLESASPSRALIRVSASSANTEMDPASFTPSANFPTDPSADPPSAKASAVALLRPQEGVSVSQRMAGLNQMAIQNLMRTDETTENTVPGTPEMVSGTPEMVSGTPEMVSGTPGMVPGTPEMVSGTPGMVPGTPGMAQAPILRHIPAETEADAEKELPGVVRLSQPETPSAAQSDSERFLASLRAENETAGAAAAKEMAVEEMAVEELPTKELPTKELPIQELSVQELTPVPEQTRINGENSEEKPEAHREGSADKTPEKLAEEPQADSEKEEAEKTESKKTESEKSEKEETEKPVKKTYFLSFTDTDIRDALEKFSWKTDLKVFAALDVQGEITCETENSDPEIILSKMLAGLPFDFVRHEDFIYVAHTSRLKNLPEPLNEYMEQVFVPKNISIEELELAFASNLSSVGSCERTRDRNGNEALCVKDWALSLDQLVEIQKLIDIPAPENRMTAYVFQHELNGTAEPLDLVSVAENRGLVLQRMAIPSLQKKNEKKSLFGKEDAAAQNIQAYSISFRTDTFMIGVRDQMHVIPASLISEPSAKIALNEPMEFEFMLNVAQKMVPFRLSLAFRENPNAQAEGESPILAEVICQPKGELDSKSKPNPVHFTMPMPTECEKSLVFQLNLGEFAHEDQEMSKNPIYAFRGNRVEKEAVIVFMPFKKHEDPQQVNIAPAGVQALIRQQEVLGRKYFGSLDQIERSLSPVCFSLAQKLRQGTVVRTTY